MGQLFLSALISKFVSDVIDKLKVLRPKCLLRLIKIFVGLLIVLVVFFCSWQIVTFLGYPRITINDNLSVKRNETTIEVKDVVVTAEMISRINKLHKLSSICFINCEFEDGVLSGLLLSLLDFSISDCTGITNFSFLSHFSDLRTLSLINCGVTDDSLRGFTCEGIESISLSDNERFSELSLLPLGNLVTLNISNTAVENLIPLCICENLKSLTGNNIYVSDLAPLANLTELHDISFDNCKIQTITPEFMSLRIERISLCNNGLTDCSGFINLTILQDIDLSYNELTDISWLAKSSEKIRNLRLTKNPLSIEQLTFLKQCSSMHTLYLDYIKMQSLDIISNMPGLYIFSANHCGIEDVTALKNSNPNLAFAFLAFNNISDISPLQGNYFALNLGFNNISDITSFEIKASRGLVLAGNPLILSQHSFDNISAGSLYLDYSNGLLDTEPKEWGPSKIFVTACPPDKQLKVIDIFNTDVFFLSQEEMIALLQNTDIDISMVVN